MLVLKSANRPLRYNYGLDNGHILFYVTYYRTVLPLTEYLSTSEKSLTTLAAIPSDLD